jgi:Fur family transcriptional regulator, ferric uptake regulator
MEKADTATIIIDSLRAQGYRITTLRCALVRLFTRSSAPLGALEITSSLEKEDVSVNKTTIYRELQFLVERSIIRELDFLEGKKRYEILSEHSRHHHLVCTNCSGITCVDVPNDLSSLHHALGTTHGFKVTHYVLEFFGLCFSCVSKGSCVKQ